MHTVLRAAHGRDKISPRPSSLDFCDVSPQLTNNFLRRLYFLCRFLADYIGRDIEAELASLNTEFDQLHAMRVEVNASGRALFTQIKEIDKNVTTAVLVRICETLECGQADAADLEQRPSQENISQ